MLTVEIKGDREVIARFSRMSSRVHDRVLQKVEMLRLQLEAKIKSKLNGEVLNVRTGALRRSINSDTQDDGRSIIGRAFSSGDVPYARIHEYGGTIQHPGGTAYIPTANGVVFISNAAAAAHKGELPRTRAHQITMPERSFMRSSLADLKQEILSGLSAAVREATAE